MTHDELQELIPLMAIDAVSDAERSEVRAHIAVCTSCATLIAEYEQVATALLKGTPATALPAQLETQLQGRVRALQAASVIQRAPTRDMRSFWQKTFSLPRWAVLGLCAVVALLLMVSGWAVATVQSNQTTAAGSSEDAEIAKLLEAPGTVSVNIKGTDRVPAAMGQVILNPESARAYLIVNNLAPLAQDQVYQVWLTRDDQRDSAGTFTVDGRGHASARIWASQPWSAYQEIGVTIEPARGSAWPTTPRLIGGPLRY